MANFKKIFLIIESPLTFSDGPISSVEGLGTAATSAAWSAALASGKEAARRQNPNGEEQNSELGAEWGKRSSDWSCWSSAVGRSSADCWNLKSLAL